MKVFTNMHRKCPISIPDLLWKKKFHLHREKYYIYRLLSMLILFYQLLFLFNYIKIVPTARKRGLCLSKKMSSIEYYLLKDNTKTRVCNTMFINTFGIGVKMVRKLVSNQRTDTEFECSDNNEDDNFEMPTTDTENLNISEKKSLLNNFLDSLPKMESHYC